MSPAGDAPEEMPLLILLVTFGSLLLVAGWEFCQPRRRREFPALRRRFSNIAFWIVNLLVAAWLIPRAELIRPHILGPFGLGLPRWPITNAALSVAAAFLLLDFLRYIVHRGEHAVGWVWRLHALHHTDPDVDLTTAVRHHPAEYLLTSAVYAGALVVFDVPAGAVMVHGLAVFAAAAFQHGNIRLPQHLEQLLQPILMTNDLHRVHHSVVPHEANANYGAVLSIWDRLFGTLVGLSAAQHRAIVFGVDGLPGPDGLKPSAMLLTPWRLPRAAAGAGYNRQPARDKAASGTNRARS